MDSQFFYYVFTPKISMMQRSLYYHPRMDATYSLYPVTQTAALLSCSQPANR